MDIKYIRFIFFLAFSIGLPFQTFPANIISDSDEIESESGSFQLEWDASAEAIVEVQQATASDFSNARTIYEGLDRARFISGLENGQYYYRVREEGGDWSESLTLTVQHQSLILALTLFGLGAVVFLLTVWVVVSGTRRAALTSS